MSRGKYERAPRYTQHFWEEIVLHGFGEDRTVGETTYTYTMVSADDAKMFPELKEGAILVLWETESGFVHVRSAEKIPEPGGRDLTEHDHHCELLTAMDSTLLSGYVCGCAERGEKRR